MSTQAPPDAKILDRETVFALCISDVHARQTWEAYQTLCKLVVFAQANSAEPSTTRLLGIELTNGRLTKADFCTIMSMAGMTHGSCLIGSSVDEVAVTAPEIDPPMFYIQPSWSRLDQLALIHLHDALRPSI